MISEVATLASKKNCHCQARKHWKELYLHVNEADDRMIRSNMVFCQMTIINEAKFDKIMQLCLFQVGCQANAASKNKHI